MNLCNIIFSTVTSKYLDSFHFTTTKENQQHDVTQSVLWQADTPSFLF